MICVYISFRINGKCRHCALVHAGYFFVTFGMLLADTKFLCFLHMRWTDGKIPLRILPLTLLVTIHSSFRFSAVPELLMSILFCYSFAQSWNWEFAKAVTMGFGLKSNATSLQPIEPLCVIAYFWFRFHLFFLLFQLFFSKS